MAKQTVFGGDKKQGRSLLSAPENRLKAWAVPRLPGWLQTYHLTLLTLVWSGINVLLAFGARQDPAMLWWVSLMVVLQYLTDLFDGELGRQRQTGLVKWGFYMDHFLDYLFLCSLVFVGYNIAPEGYAIWCFALLVLVGGFMVNAFLSFAATNVFEIYRYGVGPTEFRLVIVLVNAFLYFSGTAVLRVLLPLTVAACLAALAANTFQIHKKLWRLDMAAKQEKAS